MEILKERAYNSYNKRRQTAEELKSSLDKLYPGYTDRLKMMKAYKDRIIDSVEYNILKEFY